MQTLEQITKETCVNKVKVMKLNYLNEQEEKCRICNNYSELKSKINKIFENTICPYLSQLYVIDGPANEKKKISLDRRYFKYINWHDK
jgi:hypothetical protein